MTLLLNVESMHDQASAPPHLAVNPVNQRQLPIVTCFAPNLPHGCPFRVSLHAWHEPEVSRATQALTSPEDCVLFEARVFLDGVCAGYGARSLWCLKTDWNKQRLTEDLQRSSLEQPWSLASGHRCGTSQLSGHRKC